MQCFLKVLHNFDRNLRGGGMGPPLVLFPPCFRENVIVTCKIGFLCSSDHLLQKTQSFSFFENFNMVLIKKKKRKKEKEGELFLAYFSHFFGYQGKGTKNSFSKYVHSHTYMYFARLLTFFALPNLKKISGMVSLWYDSCCWFLFAPFWNNQ